jgi:TetR/AcrR family transcriptional repressor of nem operon
MGRTRSFDEATVLSDAGEVFVLRGYEATSIDDLVTALGVHRGSLYNAFGSKRGLFSKALDRHLEATLVPLISDGAAPDTVAERLVRGPALDLVLVAAIERGHVDRQVAETVRSALALVERAVGGKDRDTGRDGGTNAQLPTRALDLLGARLYARLAG